MSQISPAPTITLSNGVEMPRLGLGTWPMKGDEVARAVHSAIDIGYRLIDTAENYENEEGVGEGLRASGVAREDVFVTSKFNRTWHSVEGVKEACDHSLKRLGLDYIDLYLIHWPNPAQGRYVEAFEGLTHLLEAGKVRAIGMSNFWVPHLEDLFARGFTPHVNQIQLDPYKRLPEVEALNRAKDIVTEAWSPIGRGGELMEDPDILRMAETHDVTPAQVVLRWHVQGGRVPIPKSGNPTRQAENLDVFGFVLSDTDMAILDGMNRPEADRLNPEEFGH